MYIYIHVHVHYTSVKVTMIYDALYMLEFNVHV